VDNVDASKACSSLILKVALMPPRNFLICLLTYVVVVWLSAGLDGVESVFGVVWWWSKTACSLRDSDTNQLLRPDRHPPCRVCHLHLHANYLSSVVCSWYSVVFVFVQCYFSLLTSASVAFLHRCPLWAVSPDSNEQMNEWMNMRFISYCTNTNKTATVLNFYLPHSYSI